MDLSFETGKAGEAKPNTTWASANNLTSTTHTRGSVRTNTPCGGVRDPAAVRARWCQRDWAGLWPRPTVTANKNPSKSEPGNAGIQAGHGIGRY